MGVADRDYMRYDDRGRRRWSTKTPGSPGRLSPLVSIAVVLAVAAIVWRAHESSHGPIGNYQLRTCVDPTLASCRSHTVTVTLPR